MQNLNSYFIQHDLFDESNLISHCDRHLIRINKSTTLPHLRILHYAESAVYDKSWTEFCKMCRGVVVDLKNKKILAQPLAKFYNMNEEMSPSYKDCVSYGEFECSEKLDGSFIELFWDIESQQVLATTKGSLDSEQGVWATAWAKANLPEAILDSKMLTEFTLMFEMISYSNRIVIDYRKKNYAEGLYLLGVRHLKSGKVFSYQEVQNFAREHNIASIKTYSFSALDALVENVKGLGFQDEGFVIRFKSNGLLLKIKSQEYLKMHRIIWDYTEDRVLETLQEGSEATLREYLIGVPEEFVKDIEATITKAKRSQIDTVKEVYTFLGKAPKETRKDFAIWTNANVPGSLKKYLFDAFDSKPIEAAKIYRDFRKGVLKW